MSFNISIAGAQKFLNLRNIFTSSCVGLTLHYAANPQNYHMKSKLNQMSLDFDWCKIIGDLHAIFYKQIWRDGRNFIAKVKAQK